MDERGSRFSRHLWLDPYPSADDDRHLIHNILGEYDSEDLDDADEDLDDPTLYHEDLEADIEERDDESNESDVGDDDTGNPALAEGAVIFGGTERSAVGNEVNWEWITDAIYHPHTFPFIGYST